MKYPSTRVSACRGIHLFQQDNLFINLFMLVNKRNIQIALAIMLCCTMLIQCSVHLNVQHLCFLLTLILYSVYSCYRLFKSGLRFDLIDFSVAILFLITIPPQITTKTISLTCLFMMYFLIRMTNIPVCVWMPLLAIVGSIESVIVLLQFTGILTSGNNYFPVCGTFFNPGPCGCFLTIIGVLLLPHVFSAFSFTKRSSANVRHSVNIFFILSLLLIVTALILTNSRTSFLAFFTMILICIMDNANIRQTLFSFRLKSVFFLIAICCILAMFVYALYTTKPLSADSRLLTWNISALIMKEHFIWGAGIGSYNRLFAEAQELFYQKETSGKYIGLADIPEYAFNEYIELICEIGIVRLLFGLFIISLIMKRQDLNIRYSTIAIGILSITSYPLHCLSIQILFVILLSLRKSKPFYLNNRFWEIAPIIPFYFFLFFVSNSYIEKIMATKRWEKQCRIAKESLIEIRNTDDYRILFFHLSDNADFLLDYGNLLYKNNMHHESIRALSAGTQFSNDPIFLILIGMNQEQLGDFTSAEKSYQRAFSRVPNRLHPLYRLALLYYKYQYMENFRVAAQKVIEFNPKIDSEITKKMKDEIQNLIENTYLEKNKYKTRLK